MLTIVNSDYASHYYFIMILGCNLRFFTFTIFHRMDMLSTMGSVNSGKLENILGDFGPPALYGGKVANTA